MSNDEMPPLRTSYADASVDMTTGEELLAPLSLTLLPEQNVAFEMVREKRFSEAVSGYDLSGKTTIPSPLDLQKISILLRRICAAHKATAWRRRIQ